MPYTQTETAVSTDRIECSIGNLERDGEVSLRVVVVPEFLGDLAISASVDSGFDTELENNNVVHTLQVINPPNISLNDIGFEFTVVEGNPNPDTRRLTIWNSETGDLEWKVSVLDIAPWLDVNPRQGISRGIEEQNVVDIDVDISGLGVGEYRTNLQITSIDENIELQIVSVNLRVLSAVGRPRQNSVNLRTWELEGLGDAVKGFFEIKRADVSDDPVQLEWFSIANRLADIIGSNRSNLRTIENPDKDVGRALASLSTFSGTIGNWGPQDIVPDTIGEFSLNLSQRINSIMMSQTTWDDLGILRLEDEGRETLFLAYDRLSQRVLVHMEIFGPVPGQIDAIMPVSVIEDESMRPRLVFEEGGEYFSRRSALISAAILSPGELRVWDETGRVTGIISGEISRDIPSSSYYRDTVLILLPTDSQADGLSYEITGTEEGIYGLDISLTNRAGNSQPFTLSDMAIATNEVHQYSVDWGTVPEDLMWTFKVDIDGDGIFDRELSASTTETNRIPGWVWPEAFVASAIVIIAVLSTFGVIFVMSGQGGKIGRIKSPLQQGAIFTGLGVLTSRITKPKMSSLRSLFKRRDI